MNEELDWYEVKLGDVFHVKDGTHDSPGYVDSGFPLVTSKNLKDGRVDLRNVNFIRKSDFDEINKRSKVDKGDLLFSMIGTIGNLALVMNEPNYAIKNVALFKSKTSVQIRYLYYFLQSPEVRDKMLKEAKGTTQKFVGLGYLREFPIQLTTSDEQKRIVAKLDTLFAHLDQLKARLQNIPILLKQFRQAVLTQAVTGKLTEEWRKYKENLSGESLLKECILRRRMNWTNRKQDEFKVSGKFPKNESWKEKYVEPFEIETLLFSNLPEDWANATWDQITDWVTYGFTRPMPHYENGIPIITGKNVLNGYVDFDDVAYTDANSYSALSEKDKPIRGDILITKDGTIGRAAVVETDVEYCINQSVAVAWMRGYALDRKFLLYVILSETTQNEIKLKSKGVAVQHLSVTDFRKMHVPIPSFKEQKEIVHRVESLFAVADRIEASYKTLQEKIDQLPQAILSKAFRGELVAQDNNEAPTIAILKSVGENVDGMARELEAEMAMVAEPGVKLKKKKG